MKAKTCGSNMTTSTVNILKFRTLSTFYSQIKCWLSGLQLTKEIVGPSLIWYNAVQMDHAYTINANNTEFPQLILITFIFQIRNLLTKK